MTGMAPQPVPGSRPASTAAVQCASGIGHGPDLLRAALDAAAEASAGLHDRRPDLACVFVHGEDHAVVEGALLLAAERVGARTAIGCSAYGVLGAGQAAEATAAVSVWAAALPGARLRAFHLEVMRAADSINVIGLPPRRPDDVVGVLLADPWTFPADAFVAGSTEAMAGLPLAGGLAHGVRGPGSVRLAVDGRTVDRGAVGVLIGGDVGARALVSQGCRPVGPEMTVTAADGNVLLGLAGAGALDKLHEVVGSLSPQDQALASRGLQVGVLLDEYIETPGHGDFLVRGVIGVDAERGGLAVGDVVDVGRTVRFQVRDASAASADLRTMLARFRAGPGQGLDPVAGALLFSCNGRGRAFFTAADHDVRLVGSGLATSAVAGFMAAGEIGPVGGRNHLHGQSATVLMFGPGSSGDGPGSGAGDRR
jgi:small ligand-binding sensory domain FIST